MIPRARTPPTTPPAIAPTGVDFASTFGDTTLVAVSWWLLVEPVVVEENIAVPTVIGASVLELLVRVEEGSGT
jgi:hypothetical protein